MNAPKQPGLFDSEFPRLIECNGGELDGLIYDLKERGAVVMGMAVICVSRYRLSLYWPEVEKSTFPAYPR
jgi:hypothetical protein